MRVLLSMLVALVALTTSAAADGLEFPGATDAPGWNSFCVGFFDEIKAQAEQENNQVQFNESTRLANTLSAEYLVRWHRKEWNPESSQYAYWKDEGSQAAGRDFWYAPPGMTDFRSQIIVARRLTLDHCSSLGEMATVYVPQWNQLLADQAKR